MMNIHEKNTEKSNDYHIKNDRLKIARSAQNDIVDDIFHIQLNEEVVELSNQFCKYYYAVNIENHKEFFAIVFNNNFLQPLSEITLLANNKINNLNSIYGFEIVQLSSTKEEHLVVIVDHYDPSDNLANYLQQGNVIDNQTLESWLNKIIDVFESLDDLGIYGYNINLNNILMKDGEFSALKEFICAYPNYYQNNQCLAPELVECHQAARLIHNNSSDIYALGVSMFEAYTRQAVWNEYKTSQAYNYARFEHTTSKCLVSKAKMLERLKVLFKGILHDDSHVRWKIDTIKMWLDGKVTQLPYETRIENKNIIVFNNHSYSRAKAIVYALFNNWQEATKFIKDNKLFKWASRAQISSDVLEQLQGILVIKSEMSFTVANILNYNMKLLKVMSLLDPSGPIRYEGLAFSAASIPRFMHYLMVKKDKELLNKLMHLLKERSWSNCSTYSNSAGYLIESKAEEYFHQASEVKPHSLTKTIEGFCYSINPNACCNSIILSGYYINTVEDLFDTLNKLSLNENYKFNIDRHMIAFITAKLNIDYDIKTIALSKFPALSEHAVIRGINILHIVQEYLPDINISNICQVIAKELQNLLQNNLHNREFKKSIVEQLQKIAPEGNLEKIINIISDQQQFINDYNGYYEVCRKVKFIEQKIRLIDQEEEIFNTHLILGQKTMVLLSYVMCLIVTIAVVI
ncbi:MAG: hypothetical protein AB8B66_03255 [Rickettsiaceae bacterium]